MMGVTRLEYPVAGKWSRDLNRLFPFIDDRLFFVLCRAAIRDGLLDGYKSLSCALEDVVDGKLKLRSVGPTSIESLQQCLDFNVLGQGNAASIIQYEYASHNAHFVLPPEGKLHTCLRRPDSPKKGLPQTVCGKTITDDWALVEFNDDKRFVHDQCRTCKPIRMFLAKKLLQPERYHESVAIGVEMADAFFAKAR